MQCIAPIADARLVSIVSEMMSVDDVDVMSADH
jgi:hypothetical protein